MAAVRASRVRRSVGTVKPRSWGKKYPGRGGDTGAAAFHMSIVNLNSFLDSIDSDWRDAKDEAVEALRDALKRRVLTRSLVLCPIETGALRASAWVDALYANGRVSGSVGYDTDYARFVHENPYAYHAPPTQWKFLEMPLREYGPLVAEDAARAILAEFD